MKPTLTPAHGTGLATTSGITAVIALVIALSILGQASQLAAVRLALAVSAVTALFLGAGALYAARNQIGHALDSASASPSDSGIAAARALVRFHVGMAAVFAGCGFTASFRLPLAESPVVGVAPLVAFAAAVMAIVQSASWMREVGRRKQEDGAITSPRLHTMADGRR